MAAAHTLFLNAVGQVFAAGANSAGQLGFSVRCIKLRHPINHICMQPREVVGLDVPRLIHVRQFNSLTTYSSLPQSLADFRIVAIAASDAYSLAADAEGQVTCSSC